MTRINKLYTRSDKWSKWWWYQLQTKVVFQLSGIRNGSLSREKWFIWQWRHLQTINFKIEYEINLDTQASIKKGISQVCDWFIKVLVKTSVFSRDTKVIWQVGPLQVKNTVNLNGSGAIGCSYQFHLHVKVRFWFNWQWGCLQWWLKGKDSVWQRCALMFELGNELDFGSGDTTMPNNSNWWWTSLFRINKQTLLGLRTTRKTSIQRMARISSSVLAGCHL